MEYLSIAKYEEVIAWYKAESARLRDIARKAVMEQHRTLHLQFASDADQMAAEIEQEMEEAIAYALREQAKRVEELQAGREVQRD